MTRRATTSRGRLKSGLVPWVLSIALHALLLPLFASLITPDTSPKEPLRKKPEALRLVSTQEAKSLLKSETEKSKPLEKLATKLPKAPIVSLSRLTDEVATKQAKYLATVNNRVSKETVSRTRGLQRRDSAGRKGSMKQQPQRPRAASRSGKTTRSEQNSRQRPVTTKGKLRQAAPSKSTSQPALEALSSLDVLLYQASRGNSRIPRGTPEDIRGVTEGNETILNTRAYKHSWFFNRVVGALYQHWRANEAHRTHDPSGRVYGRRDRKTTIAVVLDLSGNLVDARILETSGAPHLDDEALAAFRRAQPFPNPPSELGDEDGHIRFPMGFRLEFGQPQFFRMR